MNRNKLTILTFTVLGLYFLYHIISAFVRNNHTSDLKRFENYWRKNNFRASTFNTNFIALDATMTTRIPDRDQSIFKNDSGLVLVKKLIAAQCPDMGYAEYFGDRWINVSRDMFAYSAFMDANRIRIIGAYQASSHVSLFCKIWYQAADEMIAVSTVSTQSSVIPENHGTKYTAAYFFCPLTEQIEPLAVSLSLNDKKSACEPVLPVYKNKPSKESEYNFSVCIAPLNCNYSHAYAFIEWIELNRILGSQHFTFYTYSAANNIQRLLSYYSKHGLVSVLPWNLPISVQNPEEIHYFGQLAALNDCLYRNKYKTKYLAFFDLDEFIIPRQEIDRTWTDMLKRFPVASGYKFRNTFFPINLESLNVNYNTQELAKHHKLISLMKLQHENKIFSPNERSKVIVDPDKVETVGIHFVWRYKEGGAYNVLVQDGLVHHYRFLNQTITDLIADETALKYKDALVRKVKETMDKLTDLEMI